MAKTQDLTGRALKIMAAVLLAAAAGCAGIEPPSPDRILTHPFGTGPIDVGMSQEEVRELWGEPDMIRNIGQGYGAASTQKEEWIYHGRVKNLPVNYGYLSKSLHLFFDGKNLTSFTEE